jgi:hypothetical protein
MVDTAEKIDPDKLDNYTEQELLNFVKELNRGKLDDRFGNKTVLTLAAEKGYFQVVEEVLNMGANPNTYDSRNKTALDYIRYKHVIAENNANDDAWFFTSDKANKAQDILVERGGTEYLNLRPEQKIFDVAIAIPVREVFHVASTDNTIESFSKHIKTVTKEDFERSFDTEEKKNKFISDAKNHIINLSANNNAPKVKEIRDDIANAHDERKNKLFSKRGKFLKKLLDAIDDGAKSQRTTIPEVKSFPEATVTIVGPSTVTVDANKKTSSSFRGQ